MSEKKQKNVDSSSFTKISKRRQSLDAESARKVVTRSHKNYRGVYNTKKNKKPIPCESLLEFQACNVFEFCRDVHFFDSQPKTFAYFQLGKWRKYTPDFILKLRCGKTVYIEVKPSKVLQNVMLVDHYAAIAAVINAEGYDFFIMTEKEISPLHLQTNYNYLKQARKTPITDSEIYHVIEWIKQQENADLRAFAFFVGNIAKAISFIAHGVVSIDLCKPLLSTSIIKLAKEDENEKARFNRRFAPTFETSSL